MIFQPHSIVKALEIPKIYSVFFFQLNKNFIKKPESHDFWEFVYAYSGSVTIEADGIPLRLQEGDMFIHHPNQSHCLNRSKVASSKVFIASFDLKFSNSSFFNDKIFTASPVDRYYINTIIDMSKSTFQISYKTQNQMILIASETEFGGDQIVANLIELLLLNIYRQNKKEIAELTPIEKNYSDEIVQQMIQYIENHIEEKPDIKEMARLTNYSRSTLAMRFKYATNHSVTEYHHLLLIDRSKELLKKTDKNINQIARDLNFCNQHYFSNLFKRYTQMTPSDYRAYSRAMLTDPLSEEKKKNRSLHEE